MIRICGTVTVDEEETWELPSGVSIRRAEDFEDALVRVTGCLKLDNVRLYTEDITGDGEVEGAAEKEKVYVPKVITVKDTKALSEISLEGCEWRRSIFLGKRGCSSNRIRDRLSGGFPSL